MEFGLLGTLEVRGDDGSVRRIPAGELRRAVRPWPRTLPACQDLHRCVIFGLQPRDRDGRQPVPAPAGTDLALRYEVKSHPAPF
jgi:hypothetical protein